MDDLGRSPQPVDILKNYRETVRFCMDSGSAPGYRRMREMLSAARLTDSERAALLKLDMEALEYVIELDFVESDLLQDDPAQPLEKWWWHLGKIRRGEYSADMLPDHLREIYSGSLFAK